MKKLFLVLIFFSQGVFAQSVDGEIELAGFILGQYRKAVHSQLGPPFETRKNDQGWIYEFHTIKPDTSVYVLFKYAVWDTTRIHSIQLTGDRYDEMAAFRGLRLGSPAAKVHEIFGKSSRTEVIDDPPLTLEYYDHHNYSFDIDRETNTLYGIQIYGRIMEKKPKKTAASLDGFKNAVMTKNIDSLVSNVSPDVYLYKNGKVISYCGSARSEFYNNTSEMVKLLTGDAGSVLYAFKTEKAVAVSEQRTYNDKQSLATVFKFPESTVLNEIVYLPHAGTWKVYEIKFR